MPDEVIAQLRARSAEDGRSLEEDLRDLVIQLANRSRMFDTAGRIRDELEGRWTFDSTALIREDRDR